MDVINKYVGHDILDKFCSLRAGVSACRTLNPQIWLVKTFCHLSQIISRRSSLNIFCLVLSWHTLQVPKFKVCSSYQFLNQLRANKQTNKINHWVLIYKIVVHFGVISDLVTHQIFGDLFSLPKRVLFDRLLL